VAGSRDGGYDSLNLVAVCSSIPTAGGDDRDLPKVASHHQLHDIAYEAHILNDKFGSEIGA
jgi:hypothetical protein